MAATHTNTRSRVLITHYRLKYSDEDARIEAIKADYLAASEAYLAGSADVLQQTSAGDQSASFLVGGTPEENLDALRVCLDFYERGGVPQGWAQARIA
jgi:hypothetical protein